MLLVKYHNINIFWYLVNESFIIINNSDIILKDDYLNIILLLKKILISKDNILYENYLLNSFHIYTYNNLKELKIKLKKVTESRLLNLTSNSYEVIKDNNFKEIAHKYSKYLP